ncbi:glycosyltransferase [Candidatus Sumerlaeota bacterium]|nr:glycosyltransferase [Candidatus Sumerlaeota bacterium]
MSKSVKSLSVVFLTCDRLPLTRKALDALNAQTSPVDEVLVVDTGSRDGTPEWLQEHEDDFKFQLVILTHDPGSGTFAVARNKGLDHASSELLAVIDDDCAPEPEWAERIRVTLAEYDAMGGVALPALELRYPFWWHPEMAWMAGLSVPGQMTPNTGAIHYPTTSNMALRREAFQRVRMREIAERFDKSNPYITSREDSQWWREIRRAGFRTWSDPRCIVRHHVTQDRIRLGKLLKRAYADGYTLWMRERNTQYIRQAAYDVLHAPFRAFDAVFQPGSQNLGSQNFVAECLNVKFWQTRQGTFLLQAARNGHLGDVVKQLAKMSAHVTASQAKRAARTASIAVRRLSGGIPQLPQGELRRVLVACWGFFGDMIIIEPACRAFKRAHPECKLELWTHAMGRRLHTNMDFWDAIHTEEPSGDDFDAAVIPYYHGGDVAALNRLTRRVPCVSFDADVGFARQLHYEWQSRIVKKDFARNEVENITRLFKPLSGCDPLEPYHWTFAEDDERYAEKLFVELGLDPRRTIQIHIGAAAGAKRWPAESWIELLRGVVRETGMQALMNSGPECAADADRIAHEAGDGVINCCGRADVMQLGAMLRCSPLLITGCSGPKHMAFAAGCPTVTLYGNMDERRWGAHWEREKHLFVQGGSFDLTEEELFGLLENHLMRLIEPDAVLEKVKQLLKGTN